MPARFRLASFAEESSLFVSAGKACCRSCATRSAIEAATAEQLLELLLAGSLVVREPELVSAIEGDVNSALGGVNPVTDIMATPEAKTTRLTMSDYPAAQAAGRGNLGEAPTATPVQKGCYG